MASSAQSAAARSQSNITGRNGLVDKYFYFAMSLLFAVIVVWGFSQTVNSNLFHAAPPRPFLLWIHGAAFSTWIVLYIFQSALVRTRNVKWHRFFGWFGAALGALMVVLGCVINVVMTRFHTNVTHDAEPTFMSIPFYDMLAFGTLLALAIAWRKKPELHRRLLFIATCSLMDAPFGRFDFVFNNSLFFVGVDLLILLGVGRDLLVDHSTNKVYRYALPLLILGQSISIYLWHGAPSWWLGISKAMIG
jgi:hypothetical protein